MEDPRAAADLLAAGPALAEDEPLFVAWSAVLDGSGDGTAARALAEAGARPWLRVIFRTPRPIRQNLEGFEAEIRSLAALVAAGRGTGLTVQAVWQPSSGEADSADLGYLIKRAAVVVTGAAPGARFAVGPLAAGADALRSLYGEDVAAYVDTVALRPGGDLAVAASALAELDPGVPLVLDAVSWPSAPEKVLAKAAEGRVAGAAMTLFDRPAITAEELAPLVTLAREFAGDLSYNAAASPSGAAGAWAFVRGADLDLRVVVEPEPDAESVSLTFDDAQLASPRLVDLTSGEDDIVFDQSRGGGRLFLTVDAPGPALVLRVDRLSAQELQGLDERIEVADERQMPVEEILRRLQAFEDRQARRIDRYQARNTLHLRVQGPGGGGIEATYAGDFFFRRGEGFDWVWEEFYVDGVRWRSKSLPELPLFQPEKAAALPVEIRFTKEYEYRLRGTDTVDGRDCWVVDFEPVDPDATGNLFQGTVWVDREIYSRVRTRASQLGLEGEVIANEETTYFSPIGEDGAATAWGREAIVLPLRIVSQQTLSLFSATVPLERETVLSALVINGEGFDEAREAARASDFTMVRDTAEGLRYLRKDQEGNRYVEEEQKTSRLFLVGGVFWDGTVDFPLPLAGLNYLDFDFKDSGNQLNVFFAGPFINVNLAEPELFGSRWNAGAAATGFFIDTGDELFRDGREVEEEEIESRGGAVSLFLGRPLGKYSKVDFTYRLGWTGFSEADDTAEGFVLPQDTLTHTGQLEFFFNRGGYNFELSGSLNRRADWEFWGLPGNDEFDPDQEEFARWQASLSKTFWLSTFKAFSVGIEHFDGENLDRFSRYDFGLFGDISLNGYPGGLVRAEEGQALHLSYGLNAGDQLRLEVEGDAVWATSEDVGLDSELLAGIGAGGTVALPWQMLVNFEVGYALDGPAEGEVAARIFFLKLFKGKR
ncbi:MAG: hypothetical protein AAF481_15880 [Acidobacteriota bacterium]